MTFLVEVIQAWVQHILHTTWAFSQVLDKNTSLNRELCQSAHKHINTVPVQEATLRSLFPLQLNKSVNILPLSVPRCCKQGWHKNKSSIFGRCVFFPGFNPAPSRLTQHYNRNTWHLSKVFNSCLAVSFSYILCTCFVFCASFLPRSAGRKLTSLYKSLIPTSLHLLLIGLYLLPVLPVTVTHCLSLSPSKIQLSSLFFCI